MLLIEIIEMTADEYIERIRPASLEEKQIELEHCREKAGAAAVLHDIETADYYLEVIRYLQLFDIVEERLDVPERKNTWQKKPL